MIAGQEARLQLADPVPALVKRQIRILRKTALDPKLIELLIVKTTECRCQPTERPDQRELHGDDVTDATVSNLPGKLEAILGCALHLDERIARREHVVVQIVTGVGRKREVAELVRRLERATHQNTAGLDMSRPGRDETSEDHIGPGLEALKTAPFNQVIAEPSEAICRLIVAEACAGDHAEHCVGVARAIAVAALEAEIDRPADG